MTTYQLTMGGTHAIEFNDGVATDNIRALEDPIYKEWLALGNQPEAEPQKKSK
jgi:hypothetical protein